MGLKLSVTISYSLLQSESFFWFNDVFPFYLVLLVGKSQFPYLHLQSFFIILLSTKGALDWRRTPELSMLKLGQLGMGELLVRGAPGWNSGVKHAQVWRVQGWATS